MFSANWPTSSGQCLHLMPYPILTCFVGSVSRSKTRNKLHPCIFFFKKATHVNLTRRGLIFPLDGNSRPGGGCKWKSSLHKTRHFPFFSPISLFFDRFGLKKWLFWTIFAKNMTTIIVFSLKKYFFHKISKKATNKQRISKKCYKKATHKQKKLQKSYKL